MDDDLNRHYRRWLEAEASGNEDDADAACRAAFEAIDRAEAVPAAFTARTMAAIAAENETLVRRARLTRVSLTTGAVGGGLVAAYFGAGPALSMLATALVALFNLAIGAIVSGAAGAEAGAGLWSVAGSIGRAATALVSDPLVTLVLLVLQGFAIAALIALQRLLGSDGESLK